MASGSAGERLRCSVVVPAHDESSVLEDRLGALVRGLPEGVTEVVIVANGCADDTADVARRLGSVTVVEIDQASKIAALNAGDQVATVFPRVYLDADVRLSTEALRALLAALDTEDALVAAPRVRFDTNGASWVVRAFYRVFESLPYTRSGLIGLGVYGLSARGRRRFDTFPDVVADDLFVQCLFTPEERRTVDAEFEVVTPRTARGLLAVRTRVARGNAELQDRIADLPGQVVPSSTTRQTLHALLRLVGRRPRLWPEATVYVAVTALARRRASQADAAAQWERDQSSRRGTESAGRVVVDGVAFDAVTERQVVQRVMDALDEGVGGRIITPNVDIHRQLHRDRGVDTSAAEADLVVADGMPLVWASRLQGRPLPERVAGSSLVRSLSSAAGERGRSVFLLGSQDEIADRAARQLVEDVPGLRVAGRFSPPFGFEHSTDEFDRIVGELRAADPDLVFVGLGFPKQERLMARLGPLFPHTWFLGCGGSIDMLGGTVTRAPVLVQRAGLEWVFRLVQEPRRLFKRYIVHGLPHAAGLLTRSAATRR